MLSENPITKLRFEGELLSAKPDNNSQKIHSGLLSELPTTGYGQTRKKGGCQIMIPNNRMIYTYTTKLSVNICYQNIR